MVSVMYSMAIQPQNTTDSDSTHVALHEKHFSDQLDLLRDGSKGKDPALNIRIFHGFLDSLPPDASGTIRFRAKANIGLQFLSLGDEKAAIQWLKDAYNESPEDPRAIANRALALWLEGDPEGAYRYGREMLAADPSNEGLAAYLVQMATHVTDVTDGLEGIPEAHHNKESLALSEAIFLRGREMRPAWWDWVRAAAERFPESTDLKVLVATSYVDEIIRDEEANRTQIFNAAQRERLVYAAAVLDSDWRAQPWLLKNSHDDAPYTLTNAMIAYSLLNEREAALGCVKRIVDEALPYPVILNNAVIVASKFNDDDLARRLISLAPDDPDMAFHAGVIAVKDNEWKEATALFAKARIPDSEARVVETVVALAPIREAGRPADGSAADPAPLAALVETTRDSPRGLILVAQVAAHLGLGNLSEEALGAAIEAVPEDCDLATRLMVASYAERADSPSTVIRLLEGYLPSSGFEHEHIRLAIAHAREYPHRQRNLAYFEGLSAELLHLSEISRAYASVLIDLGVLPKATALLQQLHAGDPTDTYVTLRLVEALQRTKNAAGINAVLRGLDLSKCVGAPEHKMALVHLVMREGDPERAYPAAYNLVRQYSDNSDVVLGYVELGLFQRNLDRVFSAPVVGPGTWVSIESPDGVKQSFVIDEGSDFFGIRALSIDSDMAKLVIGLRNGATFELPKMGLGTETWTISEIKTKYLHLHHRILEEYETRFPNKPGLARFTVGEDNIDSVLDVVRRSAEISSNNARVYMERAIPLCMAARLLGGNVISFAERVRLMGGQIVTCDGSAKERAQGIRLATRYRAHVAVLDPYTAWVAGEMGVLPTLKAWFGTLLTPLSTVEMIDEMIEHENEGRGREQMTLGWHEGQFYREEVTDELRDQRIIALEGIKGRIAESCDTIRVLIPNDISERAETFISMCGSNSLDSAFLAKERGAILLSDDLRYRIVANDMVGCEAVWLQATLLAELHAGQLLFSEYASAVVGLAKRAHDHIALSGILLYEIARNDNEHFTELRAALHFFAGPTAELRSHLAVFFDYLQLLWPPSKEFPMVKSAAATGLGLEALLANRKSDFWTWFGIIARRASKNSPISEYLASWLRGHFLFKEAAIRTAGAETQLKKRRRVRDR